MSETVSPLSPELLEQQLAEAEREVGALEAAQVEASDVIHVPVPGPGAPPGAAVSPRATTPVADAPASAASATQDAPAPAALAPDLAERTETAAPKTQAAIAPSETDNASVDAEEERPWPGLLPLCGAGLYTAADVTLGLLNKPFARIGMPARQMIGQCALATIVLSLSAGFGLPRMFPPATPASIVEARLAEADRRDAEKAAAEAAAAEAAHGGGHGEGNASAGHGASGGHGEQQPPAGHAEYKPAGGGHGEHKPSGGH